MGSAYPQLSHFVNIQHGDIAVRHCRSVFIVGKIVHEVVAIKLVQTTLRAHPYISIVILADATHRTTRQFVRRVKPS